MLIANGGPKQAQEMRMACKNYCNTVMMLNLYRAINGMKKIDQSEFVKVKIDLSKSKDEEGKGDNNLKTM